MSAPIFISVILSEAKNLRSLLIDDGEARTTAEIFRSTQNDSGQPADLRGRR